MRLLLAAVLPCVLLSACYDYPAVHSASDSMQTTERAWSPIAADYGATCARMATFSSDPATIPASCLEGQKVTVGLQNAMSVLDGYFGALGAVASDSKLTLNPGIDAVGSAASSALSSESAKITAVSGLAKVLAGLATGAIRAHSLKLLVDQADNASSVVSGIQEIVDKNYDIALGAEAGQWHTDMSRIAQDSSVMVPTCQTTSVPLYPPSGVYPAKSDGRNAQRLMFWQTYAIGCNTIIAHRSAIAQFDQSAKQVLESLSYLKGSKDKLKVKAITDELYRQASALYTSAAAVQKAFKGSAA